MPDRNPTLSTSPGQQSTSAESAYKPATPDVDLKEISTAQDPDLSPTVSGLDAPPKYQKIDRFQFASFASAGNSKTVNQISFKAGFFLDANGKGITFERCDFSYCIFDRTYFRKAIFRQCEFVGSRFINCNLRDATFSRCDFSYAEFSGTVLEIRDVVASLPLEPNIRADAIRSLKVNATTTGDYEAKSFLVLEEIRNTEDHLTRALSGKDSYYREKYGTLSAKFSSLSQLIVHRASGYAWGHGEQPLRLIWSIASIILALGLINWVAVLGHSPTSNPIFDLTQSLTFIAGLFLGASNTPKIPTFWFVEYFVYLIRAVYFGLLVNVIYKQIGRR